MSATPLLAPGAGAAGNPGLQVRRGWPARCGMASSGPLAGPDANPPAFPTTFFSHERGRLPALAGTRAADGTITKRHNHQAAGEEAIRRE